MDSKKISSRFGSPQWHNPPIEATANKKEDYRSAITGSSTSAASSGCPYFGSFSFNKFGFKRNIHDSDQPGKSANVGRHEFRNQAFSLTNATHNRPDLRRFRRTYAGVRNLQVTECTGRDTLKKLVLALRERRPILKCVQIASTPT
jgi:hypothetical protein